MKMFTEIEIPQEVQEYLAIMSATGGIMGLKMYKRCQEIIDNNPKWFAWEHKYKSIPQEVHDAYRNEKNPDREEPFGISESRGKGLLAVINERANIVNLDLSEEELENFSIIDAMKDLFEMQKKQDKERIEKELKEKKLWDKHYQKYKLVFRKESRW